MERNFTALSGYKALYFLSDAHLGAPMGVSETIKQSRLFEFGKRIAYPENRLFILGDLFDFWFEWGKTVIIKKHFPILCELANWVKKGLKISYLAGNHDFYLGSFLKDEIGLELHPDTLDLEFEDKKFHLFHGDGLRKSDVGYRFLKKVFRSRFNQKLFGIIPPEIGLAMANWSSHKSREAQELRAHSKSYEDYRNYASDKISAGYNYVIMGHTHIPELIPYGNGWYLNSGNWFRDFTYGIYTQGELKLETYKDAGA
jgi:UDP-2,3-diacylglucosamine hydrolase